MTNARTPRALDTRVLAERPTSWKPAALLPDPEREPGYTYRWVRVSSLGQRDPSNTAAKLREGWEPVRAEEQPQLSSARNQDGRYPDNIEIGGLLLCKMPDTFVAQRTAHYVKTNADQIASVDNNYMRENDPRMPVFRERKSTTSFGTGR